MRMPQVQIMQDDSNDDDQAWRYFRQRDFTGGENRQLLPDFLQPNQLLIAKNCVMTGEGVLETRTGKSAIYSTPLAAGITSVHRYAKEDGSKYILIQSGTVLYVYAYDGTTVFSTPTPLATSLNAAKLRSVVWKDKLYLTNGVDVVKVYDGSSLATLAGSPPKSTIIKVYGSRLYLVDVANPNNIRFSDLEDPTTWDALNVIKVRDGDGDVIVGLSPQPGGLVIFKNRTAWPLYGTSLVDFRIPETPMSNIGCAAQDTILDEGIMLGHNNIYSFSLNGVEPVSDTHRGIIESLTLADKQASFAVFQEDRQRALIHIGTMVLCLDGRYKGITSWDTLSAGCFACLNAEGDDGSILIGDSADGVVYKLDNSDTDNGAPILSEIFTAYLDYGAISKKVWRYFKPELESLGSMSSPVTLGYDIDYTSLEGSKEFTVIDDSLIWDQDNWNEANWGTTQRITETFYLHHAFGNRIAFSIKALDRIKFLGYVTKYREQGAL